MTTPIRHHVTDKLLVAYAAGNLPEAFGLVIATHLTFCDECRARLGACEAVGGAVLDGLDPETLSETSFDATLRLIDGAWQTPVPARPAGRVPAPLCDYLGADYRGLRWRPVGMGVRQVIIPTAPGARARLLSIPAGVAVPQHSHRGLELTLVLEGAFSDEEGRFGPGDVETADDALDHQPVAEPGRACICLAVTEAPLRFRGLMPRLVQPFVGI